MFERYVGLLTPREKDQLIKENQAFGGVFGLDPSRIWLDWLTFSTYWQAMLYGDTLGSDPLCADVVHGVLHPASPPHFAALSPVFRALTCEYVPAPLQARLKIRPGLRATWPVLDTLLPRLLPFLPSLVRHAPHYRSAVRRAG